MCVPADPGLHRNRGCEAINTLGIIGYGGLIVHDCWKAYLTLLGAHLLRELQAVTDSNAYPWARKMHKLLLIARRQVIQRPQQRLATTSASHDATRRSSSRGARRCPKSRREKRASADRSPSPTPITCTNASSSRERTSALYQTRRYSLTNNRPTIIRMAKAEGLRMLPNRILCTRRSNLELLQTMADSDNPLAATTIALHGNAVDCLNQDNEEPPGEQLPSAFGAVGVGFRRVRAAAWRSRERD